MNINTEGENDKKGTKLPDSELQKGQKIHHIELKGWFLWVTGCIVMSSESQGE